MDNGTKKPWDDGQSDSAPWGNRQWDTGTMKMGEQAKETRGFWETGTLGQRSNGTMGRWTMGQCDSGPVNNGLVDNGQCHSRPWDNGKIGPWDNGKWDNEPVSSETVDVGTMETWTVRSGTIPGSNRGVPFCQFITTGACTQHLQDLAGES